MCAPTVAELPWIRYSSSYKKFETNSSSKPVLLKYGVPQDSVLDPKKYTMYAKPLGAIIYRHGLSYHFYADDKQLYISFKPKEDTVKAQSLSRIENCLTDNEGWMRTNMLKWQDGSYTVHI